MDQGFGLGLVLKLGLGLECGILRNFHILVVFFKQTNKGINIIWLQLKYVIGVKCYDNLII